MAINMSVGVSYHSWDCRCSICCDIAGVDHSDHCDCDKCNPESMHHPDLFNNESNINWDEMYGKLSCKGYYFSKKGNREIFYGSLYELGRYLDLEVDNYVTMYRRSNVKIPYIFLGIAHRYHPDIYIELKDGSKIIEEIKSVYFLDRDKDCIETKMSALKGYCDKNKTECRLVTEKELNYSKERYKRWLEIHSTICRSFKDELLRRKIRRLEKKELANLEYELQHTKF